MDPSRPSSTAPNAAYRTALAADLGVEYQDNIDPAQAERAQHQPDILAGLPRRRNNDRDHLSTTSPHPGLSVSVALEPMAGPSTPPPPTATSANISHRNISALRQYFHRMGLNFSDQIQSNTIRNRLGKANLTTQTLIAAIDIAHTPSHPTLAAFNTSENERRVIISCLEGCMSYKNGFNQQTITAGLNANDNPDDLIAGLILQLRNVR